MQFVTFRIVKAFAAQLAREWVPVGMLLQIGQGHETFSAVLTGVKFLIVGLGLFIFHICLLLFIGWTSDRFPPAVRSVRLFMVSQAGSSVKISPAGLTRKL